MTTNAAALADQMTEIPAEEAVIFLLISGRLTQTNKKVVFGYHLPFYDSSDEDGGNRCLLFQLSPIHDVFRGYMPSGQGLKSMRMGALFSERKGMEWLWCWRGSLSGWQSLIVSLLEMGFMMRRLGGEIGR